MLKDLNKADCLYLLPFWIYEILLGVEARDNIELGFQIFNFDLKQKQWKNPLDARQPTMTDI